jgi:very-short-patch-repair endonuclease
MLSHREYKQKIRATRLARERAIELRAQLTDPEKILWARLKGNKLGGHAFRTQHALGAYIADFYCHRARLVIEVDGKVHQDEQLEHDARRDAWMQCCGIEVLRVRAVDVFENLDGVCRSIAEHAERRSAKIKEAAPFSVSILCLPRPAGKVGPAQPGSDGVF